MWTQIRVILDGTHMYVGIEFGRIDYECSWALIEKNNWFHIYIKKKNIYIISRKSVAF